MNENSNNTYLLNEAQVAYSKLTKGFFNFFSMSREPLKDFYSIQKSKNAFSQFTIGLCDIDITKVVGSVQKNSDFNSDFVPVNDVVQARWCNIYIQYLQDGNLPPVELYKIKDEYFVYDGNHRISVAKYLNFKTIEANVIEFIPNSGSEEDFIYSEMFFFEKQTGLTEIFFTYTNGYPKLIVEIEKYKTLMGLHDLSTLEVAKAWKKAIFNSCIKLMLATNIKSDLPNGNLFLAILNKKEQLGCGYLQATLEFMDFHNIFISDTLHRQIRRLEYVDAKSNQSLDLQYKLKKLDSFVGITFKTPLKLIREIDNIEIYDTLIDSKQFFDLKLEKWYSSKFIHRYSLIEQKILSLPEKYRKSWISIDNPEKINLEFIEYRNLFTSKLPGELTEMEVVFNYILEIYIPVIDLISKRNDVAELYYLISSKYLELHGYKKSNSIYDAYKMIFSNSNYFRKFFSSNIH